uniref:Uncharacterized protein n=1 Tax=Knipowitschia caucasica TaxID=637954 RepID=A0AAV2KN54_KNICA
MNSHHHRQHTRVPPPPLILLSLIHPSSSPFLSPLPLPDGRIHRDCPGLRRSWTRAERRASAGKDPVTILHHLKAPLHGLFLSRRVFFFLTMQTPGALYRL